MHKNSIISIITPCYNSATFLREAIESVLAQTYPHFEWIIVDDGSIDDTEAIIHTYRDNRIRYYKQENKGQSFAANFGLKKATGDYIKFFDSDDVINPTHLEAQLKKLNGCNDSLASCSWGRFYDNNPKSAAFIQEPVWKDMKPLQWIKTALSQKSDMMAAWLWLIPKPVIDKSGGWNEGLTLNNDFEFSVRLILNSKNILFTENAKLYYRSGINGLSQLKSKKAFLDAYWATKLGCNHMLKVDNSQEIKQLCANRYQQWIFRIYPTNLQIIELFQKQVNELGGSNVKMEGGAVFLILSNLIGWRYAKKVKYILERYFGYKKLPFN